MSEVEVVHFNRLVGTWTDHKGKNTKMHTVRGSVESSIYGVEVKLAFVKEPLVLKPGRKCTESGRD